MNSPATDRIDADNRRRLYVGSYSDGISLLCHDSAGLRMAGLTATTPAPSFLAWHPSRAYLYSVGEADSGRVTAFAVESDDTLRELGSQPTGGSGPCHVMVHPGGNYLLTANYGSGSVSVHPVGADGAVAAASDLVQHAGSGPEAERQSGPHAHNVRIDLSGRYVLVADLGTDEIRSYHLDAVAGELESVHVIHAEPGSGPRHIAFHPSGRVFVADELSSTVTTYELARSNGSLTRLGSVPAAIGSPTAGVRNYPSEIAVSPDGRFVYVANRGLDCVSVFAVGEDDLQPVKDVPTEGEWPRHLAVAGTDLYVANQHSDTVVAFTIDESTGVPSPAHSVSVPAPACVLP